MQTDFGRISSRKVLGFYKGLDEAGVENHGLLVTRRGETMFEHYISPYGAEQPHTLFSVTKSLVSTAVGFAVEEGLLTLDTKIGPYFSDYKQSPGTENITVRQLLTMHSGKQFSFLQDMTGDYVAIFLKAPLRKKNGFLYSNNDVHMLSALLQRLTGETVRDYLVPRLFEPLGIEPPAWETDCKGISVGGTGGYLPLRALVKIMECYINGGMYEGRQVIPAYWAREAGKKQAETNDEHPGANGYGFLFWTRPDHFCMNGMYGQIISGYPATGTVIGYTNVTLDDSPLERLQKQWLLPALEEADDAEGKALLETYLQGKDEKITVKDTRGTVPGGEFRMEALSKGMAGLLFPASLIPRSLSTSMAKRPKKSFDRFTFTQDDNTVTVRWYEEDDPVTVICGLDGTPRLSACSLKGYPYTVWSHGYWEGNVLHMRVKALNTLSSLTMTFRFEHNGFGLRVADDPSFEEFILTNVSEVAVLEKYKPLKAAASGIMKLLLRTITAEMKFKK